MSKDEKGVNLKFTGYNVPEADWEAPIAEDIKTATTTSLAQCMQEYIERTVLIPLHPNAVPWPKETPEQKAEWAQRAAQDRLAYRIAQKYEWFIDRAFKRAFPEQHAQVEEWENHYCDE